MLLMKEKIIKNPEVKIFEDEYLLKIKAVKVASPAEENIFVGENVTEEVGKDLFDFKPEFFKDEKARQNFIKEFNDKKYTILKNLNEEIEQLKAEAIKEGTKEGYEEGFSRGKAEVLKKFSENVEIIKKSHHQVNIFIQEIVKNSGKDILKLALSIAEKIIREKINENDEIVLNTLKFLLKTVPQVNKVIIYLNPIEFERIKKSSEEFAEILERYKEVKFIDDSRIEKGGVVVETELGNIDGQPGSQLEKLIREFENN